MKVFKPASGAPALTLAMDTSQAFASMALAQNGQIQWHTQFISQHGHTENFLFLLDTGLKVLGKKLEQIEQVLVTQGPGSFTGLRVGLSHLKGLFWEQPEKIIALKTQVALALVHAASRSSLLGLTPFSFDTPSAAVFYLALVEAQKNEYYASFFQLKPGPTEATFQTETLLDTVAEIELIVEQLEQLQAQKNLSFEKNQIQIAVLSSAATFEKLKAFLQQKVFLQEPVFNYQQEGLAKGILTSWLNFQNLSTQNLAHNNLAAALWPQILHEQNGKNGGFPQIIYQRLPEAFALIQKKKTI